MISNVCEHGDHPAPEGQRFCSEECQRCEHKSENGCDGICGKKKVEVCALCTKTRGHHRRSGPRSWGAHQTALEKLRQNPGTAVPIGAPAKYIKSSSYGKQDFHLFIQNGGKTDDPTEEDHMHTITIPLNGTQAYHLHHNSDWSGNVVLTYTEGGEEPLRHWNTARGDRVEFPAKVLARVLGQFLKQVAAHASEAMGMDLMEKLGIQFIPEPVIASASAGTDLLESLKLQLHTATHCDCGKELSRGLCRSCDNDD